VEEGSIIVFNALRHVESVFSLLMDRQKCQAFIGDLDERYRNIQRTENSFSAVFWFWRQVFNSFWPLVWAALSARLLRPIAPPTVTPDIPVPSLDFSKTTRGLSTGFVMLDQITGGLHGGELIVLAARPSMGKTTLALNIATHVATHPSIRKPVAVFSLEMSSSNLLTRMLCSAARVDQHKFRRGYVNSDERRKLQFALADLTEAPLFLDDTAALDTTAIRAKLLRLKNESGLSLVVVDYFQLMSGPNGSETRNQELSAISRGLKVIAKDLDVPVIVLSQLSRPSEMSLSAQRPTLSDLRDFGSIEEEADLVAFIYREEIYKRDREDLRGHADLIIAKHRNGPVGTVPLRFLGNLMRFENRTENSDRKN
jgi:replicative DNA helicase